MKKCLGVYLYMVLVRWLIYEILGRFYETSNIKRYGQIRVWINSQIYSFFLMTTKMLTSWKSCSLLLMPQPLIFKVCHHNITCLWTSRFVTKVWHHLKQYLPAKSHKWGNKLYVLPGFGGLAYNFEIYAGNEDDSKFRLPNETVLWSVANITHKVCFDNFYTSLPIINNLVQNTLLPSRTVPGNMSPITGETDTKNQRRETTIKNVSYSYIDGFKVAILWNEYECLTFLSSFAGKYPEFTLSGFDQKL